MTGRARASKTAAVLAVLLVGFTWLAGRHPTPEVEIGDALQSLATGSGDAAARHTEQVDYDDEDLTLEASYVISDDQLPADAPPAHQALWAIAVRVIPDAQRREIRQLNVVTDGVNGTLGMVHRSGMAADRWVLSMDDAESDRVLEDTLVHELAHVLTLRRADLDAGAHTCAGVRIAIGCAADGSELAAWATEFWPDPTQATTYDHDDFVSEYAASGVHEDLAETFLSYVLGDERDPSPRVAAKLAFFDEHPDLAAVAQQVRTRLALPG
jgi:hypothetical protein